LHVRDASESDERRYKRSRANEHVPRQALAPIITRTFFFLGVCMCVCVSVCEWTLCGMCVL
jgi:hypothetical protein